jgi:hypothetical protein
MSLTCKRGLRRPNGSASKCWRAPEGIGGTTAMHICFTFVETGAGWGRWSARALKAAQRFPGIKTAKVVLIGPHHCALARTHMAHNGFQPEEHYT